jgi:hypothetical protein
MDVMQRNIATLRRLRRRNAVRVHPLAPKRDNAADATNEMLWVFTDELIALMREVAELRTRVKMLERS